MLVRKAVLAAALASVPATATATPFWEQWTAHIPCVSFVSQCPEITLWSRTDATGSTLNVTFRNPHNLTTANMMTWWNIYGPGMVDLEAVTGVGWYAEGSVKKVFGPDGTSPPSYIGPNWSVQVVSVTYSDGASLLGCDLSPPGGVYSIGYYQICPRNGFGGSVTMFYQYTTRVRVPDLTEVWFYGANDFYAGGYISAGEFGPPAICNDVLACSVTVAPEPSTWFLLASGLTLIGLAGWIRRRRSMTIG